MAKKVKKDICPSCGVSWEKHMGMIGTCAKLEAARKTLKILHTWAKVPTADLRLDLFKIVTLCDKTLAEIK